MECSSNFTIKLIMRSSFLKLLSYHGYTCDIKRILKNLKQCIYC